MLYNLTLQPSHSSYYNIIHRFNNGEPLTPAQINFLERMSADLSDGTFDKIYNYYHLGQKTYLEIKDKISLNRLKQLRNQVAQLLHKSDKIRLKINPKQLFQLRALLADQLIYYHGNQFLTGAPYYQGGIPHIDFIQWGNLFGVVEYEEILGETAEKGNILIHFEKVADNTVTQLIQQYSHQYLDIRHKPKVVNTDKPTLQTATTHFMNFNFTRG